MTTTNLDHIADLIASWGDFTAVELTAERGASAADAAALDSVGLDPEILVEDCRRRCALSYVSQYGDDEDAGPDDPEEIAAMFRRVFGRSPDREDGTSAALWSHICAAAQG